MRKLEVGDKVVALTTPENGLSQNRVRGMVYKVTDTFDCPKGDIQLININDTKPTPNANYIGCICGELHENNGLSWTSSDHFSNIDDVSEALDKALSEEDYDMAIALRDLKEA